MSRFLLPISAAGNFLLFVLCVWQLGRTTAWWQYPVFTLGAGGFLVVGCLCAYTWYVSYIQKEKPQ